MRILPILFTSCLLAVLLIGCSKEKDPEPTAIANSGPGLGYAMTIDSPVGAYFMVDGQEVILDASDWSASGSGYPHPAGGFPYANCAFVSDSTYWGWTFGITSQTDPVPLPEMLALFAEGPRPYIIMDELTEPGVSFNTSFGNTMMCSGDQNGSEFEIEDMEFVDAPVDTIKVLARFNCKLCLWSSQVSETYTVTNGRLRFDLPCLP